MPTPPAESPFARPTRVPHVYVLIFGLSVLVALLSLVVPGGSYERDANGRVVAGTFVHDSALPVAERPSPPRGWALLFAVLQAPLRGIDEAAPIIAFILIIGGAFKVIEETRAFETAILSVIARLEQARFLIIPAAMLVFSAGGAIFGLSEEIIPFVLLFVPVMRLLGFPPIIAVAVPMVGSQMGFAGAMVNPFSLGIAQSIAELPPLSGWPFRTVLWVVLTVLGVGYVSWQARRFSAPPTDLEPTHSEPRSSSDSASGSSLSGSQVLVLLSLAAGVGVILWGVAEFAWYVTEIGAVFLAVGVVAGVVGRLSPNRIAKAFVAGARELVSAALVVGLARGIVVLAGDARVLDTVLHGAAAGLAGLNGAVALNLMFLFQTLLNFFIPSGSGQAALTMPIMAPLADLVGLTRQMAVLAFQLGDGFSNMIVPTSAVLMGSLEAAKTPYEKWFRFIWPLQAVLLGVGAIVLTIAYVAGFGL